MCSVMLCCAAGLCRQIQCQNHDQRQRAAETQQQHAHARHSERIPTGQRVPVIGVQSFGPSAGSWHFDVALTADSQLKMLGGSATGVSLQLRALTARTKDTSAQLTANFVRYCHRAARADAVQNSNLYHIEEPSETGNVIHKCLLHEYRGVSGPLEPEMTFTLLELLFPFKTSYFTWHKAI